MKSQKDKKNKIRGENTCEVWRTAAHKCFSERGTYLMKIARLEREIRQQRSPEPEREPDWMRAARRLGSGD